MMHPTNKNCINLVEYYYIP